MPVSYHQTWSFFSPASLAFEVWMIICAHRWKKSSYYTNYNHQCPQKIYERKNQHYYMVISTCKVARGIDKRLCHDIRTKKYKSAKWSISINTPMLTTKILYLEPPTLTNSDQWKTSTLHLQTLITDKIYQRKTSLLPPMRARDTVDYTCQFRQQTYQRNT